MTRALLNSTKMVQRAVTPLVILALIAALSLGGCATTGTLNLISLDQEWEMGREIERDLNRQVTLVNDRTTQNYINRIGQELVRQTDLADRPWRFYVVDDPSVNAFNAPGGLVYVHTGLIQAANNVAELTGVIAHEVAHGARRHGTKRISQVYGLNIGASILLGQDPGMIQQIAAQLAGTGAMAHFSRSDEYEADRLGVRYMYQAGYDPQGLASMFQHLINERQRRPSSVEQFFSSHPLTEDRIDQVQKEIDKLPARSGLRTSDAELSGIQRRLR